MKRAGPSGCRARSTSGPMRPCRSFAAILVYVGTYLSLDCPPMKNGLTSDPACPHARSMESESVPPENASATLEGSDRCSSRSLMASQETGPHQGLVYVFDEILDILDPHAEPQESVSEPVIKQVLALIIFSEEHYEGFVMSERYL